MTNWLLSHLTDFGVAFAGYLGGWHSPNLLAKAKAWVLKKLA